MSRKNEKGLPKGSILDLFLIFLFVLCIVGTLLRYQELRRRDRTGQFEGLYVIALTDALDARTAACISEGEMLYLASGEVFGKVASVSLRAFEEVFFSDGKYHRFSWESDRRCRLEMEIALEGVERDGVWQREGKYPMAVGERVTLYSERGVWNLGFLRFVKEGG